MSKEVVTKKVNEVSTDVTAMAGWEDTGVTLGQDLVIAKILPMQGMSKLVTDGKATFGSFVDSLTGVKLGSVTEPIAMVPFHVEKFWDIQEMNEEGKFKWVRTIPLVENPADENYNDNLTWSDKENGVEIKRVRRMNFYVLLNKEIDDNSAVPYILSFKSTSYKEGKKLLSQMYMRNRKVNLPPPGYNIILRGEKKSNDDGTWIVPEYDLGPKSTPEQMQEALNWFKVIRKGGVKVDESDVQAEDDAQMSFDVDDAGTGKF